MASGSQLRNCPRCLQNFTALVGQVVCFGCKSSGAPSPSYGDPLTHRDLEVVALVCRGLKNREIGEKLHLAEGTIKEYLYRIGVKTGANSRFKLMGRRIAELERELARLEERVA